MRLNGVRRFGVVGALIFVPSSASTASDWWCHGTAVKRCATVWWDESADTFRVRAKITDVVRVTNVKLQRTAIVRGDLGQVIGGGVSPAAVCSLASLSSAPTNRYGWLMPQAI